jgi:hypothetical protein
VDLYLIHWPMPSRDLFVESWLALEKIYADGRARSIGVSNFSVGFLNRLRSEATVVPVVNQIELHPRFPQEELRAYHQDHQIVTEAWSPIGQGQGLLDDPTVTSVAKAHGKSPAQAVLRRHLQLGNSGNVVIPKSVTPQRFREISKCSTTSSVTVRWHCSQVCRGRSTPAVSARPGTVQRDLSAPDADSYVLEGLSRRMVGSGWRRRLRFCSRNVRRLAMIGGRPSGGWNFSVVASMMV